MFLSNSPENSVFPTWPIFCNISVFSFPEWSFLLLLAPRLLIQTPSFGSAVRQLFLTSVIARKNCQSKIVWCEATQTLAVLPCAIKGLNKHSIYYLSGPKRLRSYLSFIYRKSPAVRSTNAWPSTSTRTPDLRGRNGAIWSISRGQFCQEQRKTYPSKTIVGKTCLIVF